MKPKKMLKLEKMADKTKKKNVMCAKLTHPVPSRSPYITPESFQAI